MIDLGLTALAVVVLAETCVLAAIFHVGPRRTKKMLVTAARAGEFDVVADRFADLYIPRVVDEVKKLLTGDMQLWSNAEKGVQARQERAVEEAVSTALSSTAEGKGWIKAIGEFVSPELATWLEKNPKLLAKTIDKLKGSGLGGGTTPPASGSPAHLLPDWMRR